MGNIFSIFNGENDEKAAAREKAEAREKAAAREKVSEKEQVLSKLPLLKEKDTMYSFSEEFVIDKKNNKNTNLQFSMLFPDMYPLGTNLTSP